MEEREGWTSELVSEGAISISVTWVYRLERQRLLIEGYQFIMIAFQ
jgi:hypothetical protein